ncbi:hypothetical protein [Chloroflexus aggregans]|uniref:hypothetical protein n=1 Tax=Chloroflexus aggregans TaxID=152260 RepID=UPI00059D92F0|nr:hypothetical protein [Chloroflexus aggregans]
MQLRRVLFTTLACQGENVSAGRGRGIAHRDRRCGVVWRFALLPPREVWLAAVALPHPVAHCGKATTARHGGYGLRQLYCRTPQQLLQVTVTCYSGPEMRQSHCRSSP